MDYQGNELDLFQHATHWKRYFPAAMRKFIKGDILEVGAGIGANTKYLITPQSTTWTMIEPDPVLAGRINGQTSEIDIPKTILNGTIDLVAAKKFDTIIYIDVLEHIENSAGELNKCSNILNTGGHLIILVPAFQFLFSAFDESVGHFRRYNKPMLRKEIPLSLKEKKLYYLDSMGFMASMANKLILRKSEVGPSRLALWDRFLVPLSTILDPVLLHSFGKSLVGVYEKTSQPG
jgi:SAM-dependent methyltransferase